jgi:hypothetical protein
LWTQLLAALAQRGLAEPDLQPAARAERRRRWSQIRIPECREHPRPRRIRAL